MASDPESSRAGAAPAARLAEFRPPPAGPGVRLHLNEPSFPPSPRVIEAIRAAAADVRRYPDPLCNRLRAALCARLGVPPQRIVFGAGSDELIGLIASAFVAPGARVVLPEPGFPRYLSTTRLAGADAVRVPLNEVGANDARAMLAAIDGSTAAVLVATPHSPTGAMLSAAELEALAAGVPDRSLLVVDEAYFEFAQVAGGADALRVLGRRAGRWIGLRTFSKAYGLAGLRVGYAIAGSDDLAELLNRVRGMFNVGALGEAAALAALADEAYMRESVAATAAERERLRSGLAALGVACLPSAANFLAARLPIAAAQALPRLAQAGVLVSPVGGPPYERHVRITIGTPQENDAARAAIAGLVRAEA